LQSAHVWKWPVVQHKHILIKPIIYIGLLFVFDLRYDTRCYFNVRSKADISQLNLPKRNRQLKKCKNRKKLKSKKTDMLRSNSKQYGKSIIVNPG